MKRNKLGTEIFYCLMAAIGGVLVASLLPDVTFIPTKRSKQSGVRKFRIPYGYRNGS